MVKNFFGGIQIVLRVFIFFVVFSNVSGCFNTGWEFLVEDLISDVCPILCKSAAKIKDIFGANEDEGPVSSSLVSECLRCGRELSRAAAKKGNQLVKSGVNLQGSSRPVRNFFSGKLQPEFKEAAEMSHQLLTATKLLQTRLCSSSDVTPNTFMSFLENQVIKVKDLSFCKPLTLSSVSCGTDKYRTIDGSCNNAVHPTWGQRGAALTRITTPRYADGIYAMPVARSGRPLPNPRLLSNRLFTDQPIASRNLNYMNMQWGQFITHDLVFHVMEVTDEGGIQCCLADGADILPAEYQNDKCIPICVPDDDPFYRYHGIRCINFVRSVTTPREDCTLGYAEQMNTVSSYLDGSMVYGSDKKKAAQLRTKSGGKLKVEKRLGSKRGFLPAVEDKMAACDLRNSSEPCYLAGDVRINQTPTLALMHTILLREHNRVADILSSLNPRWNDEKVYQEARRIVIAEIQHITYQEWLPLNFGENYFRYYRISPSTLYSHDYDVNPGNINGFAAGAFRFLHSIVPDSLMTVPQSCHAAFAYKLSDHYMNPYLLETSSTAFDDLVRGILFQSGAESDPFCSGEITNLLFKSSNKWGLDLIAMDIQRGRDHGLASYNDYREICGLRKAIFFQDLADVMTQDRIAALSLLYESVDDIDMFVGGSLESAVPGSILGHTFQCIVAEQFYRTRVGDRFFYDHSEKPHSFTPEQLQEIKKSSMARLICDNTDSVRYVQRRAFEMESPYNPKNSCYDYTAIPYVDLTAWKSS